MAIPIKRYIDIGTTVVDAATGQRDYSALLFTSDAMVTSTPTDVSLKAKWTDYGTNGKVVTLTADEVTALFPSTTATYKLCAKYFGYTSITGRSPSVVNVVKTGSETALAKFNSVLSTFNNFGAFTFVNNTTLGTSGSGGLLDVAMRNQAFGLQYAMVVPVTSTTASASAVLNGIRGCFKILEATTTEYTAWIPLSYVAARNYDAYNNSSSMMYKTFPGVSIVVEDETDANTYDDLFINYIALVQTRGTNRRFLMRGVCADGMDLGVYVDASWITSQIENGWISLATGSNRIPATSQGASLVSTMITSVAERAIANGCILTGKYLTQTQIDKITQYVGAGAVTAVQSVGYYIDVDITYSDGKYVCTYTLVYAKGDTIEKIVGQHYLA